MVKLSTTYKNPRRRFRKFNRAKIIPLLAKAPKFFVFHGFARYEFNSKIKTLKLDIPLNLGKHGKFTLVALDGTTATIKHRARRQKNDRLIHIRTNKTVAIGHGMFIMQP